MILKRRLFKESYKINKRPNKFYLNKKSKNVLKNKRAFLKKFLFGKHKKPALKFLKVLHWNQITTENKFKELKAANRDIKFFLKYYTNYTLSADNQILKKYLPPKIWATMTWKQKRAHKDKCNKLMKPGVKFIKLSEKQIRQNRQASMKVYFLNSQSRPILKTMNDFYKKQYLKLLITSAENLLKPTRNKKLLKSTSPLRKTISITGEVRKNLINFHKIRKHLIKTPRSNVSEIKRYVNH